MYMGYPLVFFVTQASWVIPLGSLRAIHGVPMQRLFSWVFPPRCYQGRHVSLLSPHPYGGFRCWTEIQGRHPGCQCANAMSFSASKKNGVLASYIVLRLDCRFNRDFNRCGGPTNRGAHGNLHRCSISNRRWCDYPHHYPIWNDRPALSSKGK